MQALERGPRGARRLEEVERPDRPDSRHHHAERPAREQIAAEAERASSARPRPAAEAERHSPARPPTYGDRPQRRERPAREDEAPVIGLGDHVPDFLLRPVKARAKAAPEPIEADE